MAHGDRRSSWILVGLAVTAIIAIAITGPSMPHVRLTAGASISGVESAMRIILYSGNLVSLCRPPSMVTS